MKSVMGSCVARAPVGAPVAGSADEAATVYKNAG